MHASAEVASRIISFASADGAPIACPDDKVPRVSWLATAAWQAAADQVRSRG
jgi:hypothetical protein